MRETYLEQLDLGFYELTFAFEGLADQNVWKRPADGLLSIGEIAGHIAYWEAVRLAGEGPIELMAESARAEPPNCRVSSPLIDNRFQYHTANLPNPPSGPMLAITADKVGAELQRIHKESVSDFKSRNPDLDNDAPGWPPGNTYREFLKYLAFHVAYHTGQIYSVRHLLGDTPPDN
jgi:hypothetical protein